MSNMLSIQTYPRKYHGQNEYSKRGRPWMTNKCNQNILPDQRTNLPKEEHNLEGSRMPLPM